MSRYKPNRIVRADWWDEGEHVTFTGTLGFLPAQRVAYHVNTTQSMAPSTPDDVQTLVDHMTAALLETLDPAGWTLRGPDGGFVPLTADGLAGLPVEDIAFLFKEAFPPADDAPAPMTDAAKGAGLTPSNFPAPSPDQSVLSPG